MKAILKRDFVAYFTSPIAYSFITVFSLFAGYFFVTSNLLYLSPDIRYTFSNLNIVFIVIVPLLTVKMITEERKSKTDQILLTSPISVSHIVLGKYFAAIGVFIVALLPTLIYIAMLAITGKPSFGEIITSYIGFFLMGSAFISVGLYVSSLTDNQFIASIGSFAVLMFLWILDSLTNFLSSPFIYNIINWISFKQKYTDFSMGILSLEAIVYYLSVCVLFIFLTIHSIEKRRWA